MQASRNTHPTKEAAVKLWTDYPFVELGDEPNKEAPIREAKLISYDGDKYVDCVVDGVEVSFKAGYLYMERGRCDEVPPVTRRILHRFKPKSS